MREEEEGKKGPRARGRTLWRMMAILMIPD